MNRLQNLRRSLSNKIVQPDYAGLTNVVFHGRYEGLVNNTNNTFGTVDVSGNVTKLKSVSPHATGVEFDSNGTAPTLTTDGIQFGGAGRLRHATAATFNNFHYRASINDLKWTIHAVVKFGTTDNPDALYGFCGNNGGSTLSKGICLFFDDRSAQSTNNALTIQITRGTSQSFITLAANTNIIKPNQFLDIWIEVDKSQIQEDEINVYINGFRFIVSNRIDSSSMVTTPTYGMEIGGIGNAVGAGILTLKEITFMDGIMSDSFRQSFITARMYKYGIAAFPQYVDGLLMSSEWNLVNTFSESRYYLSNHLGQSPIDSNTIVSIFADGVNHVFDVNKKVSRRISTDKGRTWSSKTTVFDPGGLYGVQDLGAGYGDDGRLHVFADAHTGFTVGQSHQLWYLYSDDDGFSWSTPVDITSVVPSDGLLTFRVYSTVIENNGVLMCSLHKATDEGSFANSANYVLRSTDNGANWTTSTIRASAVTFINETQLIALSSTALLAIARNDTTLEWHQFYSSDNGATWTNQGDQSFGGESLTTYGGPVRLRKFQINGNDVIVCYFIDRTRDLFKAIYATPADLIASGASGWDIGTKFTIHQGSGEHLHYGDVCHYDNDFKALAMYVIDTYPTVGGTENELYTIDVPTFHYPFVKSALGL